MQTGNFTGFHVEVRDPGIAWIQFNTPERLNGLTQAIKRDLTETIVQAQMDNGVRVLVFTGEGRAFSAGDDISGQGKNIAGDPLLPPIPPGHDSDIGTYEGLRHLSQTLNTGIRSCDKISVAAVNGVAIQTGMSLALACDFRIAAQSSRMGSATLRFGLLPDEGGQYLLVQLIGVAKTLDFLINKRIASADECLQLGLVHEVVADDVLETRTMAFATELANGPQVSMRLLKRSVYNAWDLSWEQSLDEIAAKTAISDHHPDAREGGTAFREKRAPSYNKWLEDSASKEHPGRVRLRNVLDQLEGEVRRLGLSVDEVQALGQDLMNKLPE
ncbi:MAG: enoyl-CoA hydratase/isomerase family protein [Pseudomonadales bacterium]|jgi:2-(1,2-epoxy-1,2-dihydrophenyl)acetyl-CoA isomerase|nr:enoyl-CoA hydratase/isomerase family protein [Pseudomonadales bacterium]MDP7359221.1 enoyl-CoA hydratase/isomerase family protein [Pseudomonadales bacterium]MDP7595178.1 enoyl-CoA hydratase/isomerase family protein [Pseudomonadales bacterium]HJN50179.1 enoyl-CoA hydratase/isomerase family protein [Pseudomonadales bacterium]